MAGHSHWAGIKHKKALVDNKRGKLWSRLSKAIIVAAKLGGGDLDTNIRLRKAIDDAKAVSMPKDNIERAVKRGTGELDGGNLEEVLYEGYGPGGVAILCDVLTDNRNRTAPEMRVLFERNGGNLGTINSVAYLFDRKGLILFAAETDEERLTEVALEGGADDIQRGDSGGWEVTCPPENFSDLLAAFEAAQLQPELSEVTRLPQTTVEVEGSVAQQAMRLLELLDEHDDVQSVSTNLSITDDSLGG
ncbi:putative transcriptional regulatory protein [Rosistilla carotiformis]|uniref:Probable transcriptional regulatory protein Poly24_03710 n=1 Tax=Rosistilla carotiformis TaxID=2528017 RepID=A0A518JMC7_9BACT|nr:YebC/PmpR family DNA-binding transcriptional regulator [Rosistilla carotiformis]QDV66684.1 putative transcriptional regulatory protein [Rosistilla carotiformis]